MDTEYLFYKTIGISSILACIIALVVVHFYNQSQIIHENPVIQTYVEPNSIEEVDTTEIMIDKKLFVCIGDVDLEISDVGVVSFDCQTEEKKVHIVTNPQDMFVTQYLIKKEL
jgi:hypothetical protein